MGAGELQARGNDVDSKVEIQGKVIAGGLCSKLPRIVCLTGLTFLPFLVSRQRTIDPSRTAKTGRHTAG